MTEEQKHLLENWEDEMLAAVGEKYIYDSTDKLEDLIHKLLQAQEAKTREECAEIVEESKWDLRKKIPSLKKDWNIADIINEALEEDKQKIINNQINNENN